MVDTVTSCVLSDVEQPPAAFGSVVPNLDESCICSWPIHYISGQLVNFFGAEGCLQSCRANFHFVTLKKRLRSCAPEQYAKEEGKSNIRVDKDTCSL